jgi:hypothetical protein
MNDKLYQYLKKEFEFNNLKKYLKYFDEWVNNLTLNQIEYYKKLWLKQ